MDLKKIIYKVEDSIAIIEMNNMKTYNAISWEMLEELEYCFHTSEENDSIKVVIIRGQEKAFCAGGDINEQKEQIFKGGEIKLPKVKRAWELTNYIRKMSKIVIASVSGVAAGAGANLALACDFIIAVEGTKFIQSFANMSLTPDMGGVYMLAKDLGWHKAMDLIVNAKPIYSEDLYDNGVVYKIAKNYEELESITNGFATKISNGPILSYRNSKRLIYQTVFKDFESYHKEEYESNNELANTDDFKEAVTAFLEKRKPEFKGY